MRVRWKPEQPAELKLWNDFNDVPWELVDWIPHPFNPKEKVLIRPINFPNYCTWINKTQIENI